jgi:hypothetical protein
MGVAVAGLFRLRTWGLIAALAANVLVATFALTHRLPTSHLMQKLFACTAILQLVVPVPMLVTILRRRAPGPDRWQSARGKAATLGVAVLGAFSVFAAFLRRAVFMR